MNNLDDFSTFLGRAGNLYIKRNLCPPFYLREFAERWWMDGISFSFCVEQVSRHLAANSDRYRNGSGDWGLRRLDEEIRQSWNRLERPRSSSPARTDRLVQSAADNGDQWFVGPMEKGLDEEIRQSWNRLERPRSSSPARTDRLVQSAADNGDQWFVGPMEKAPSTSEPIGLKQIDKAMAFLRRELADREVEAVAVEANAKVAGISPRTLDRARARLRVVSRRRGFAETGRCWLSLPTAP